MKYLKFCSFAVALLLFAAPAMADVDCNLESESYELRAESMHEELDELTVVCTWESGDFAATGATEIPTFDLDIVFSTDVTNSDDMEPYLEFKGNTVAADDASVNTKVMPDDIGSDDIEWEDVRLPIAGTFGPTATATTWDAANDWDSTSDGSGEFMIKGIYLDASETGSGDEVTASIRMSVANALATGIDFDSDRRQVDVADVEQGIELSFTDGHSSGKAGKPNACNPVAFNIAVDIEEGHRDAWEAENDILLKISSGKLAHVSGNTSLSDTEEGGTGELIYEVNDTNSKQTAGLVLKITPPVAKEGDEIMLTAEFLPKRRTDEEFEVSGEIKVATYSACKGEKLFFPFVTDMSGWDTGIVVVNDSKVDGSCYLDFGNDTDADDMEDLEKINVEEKDYKAFLVSDERPDYQGSLGVQCTFKNAHGYIFLYDGENMTGQGYVVEGE